MPSDLTAVSAADNRSETPGSLPGILAMVDSTFARRSLSAATEADPTSAGLTWRAGTSPASQPPKNTSATIAAPPSPAKNICRAPVPCRWFVPLFTRLSGASLGSSARGGSAVWVSGSGVGAETSVAVRSMVGVGLLRRLAPSTGSGVVRLSDMRASFSESDQPRQTGNNAIGLCTPIIKPIEPVKARSRQLLRGETQWQPGSRRRAARQLALTDKDAARPLPHRPHLMPWHLG